MKSQTYEQNKRYIIIVVICLLIFILLSSLGTLQFAQIFFTDLLLPVKQAVHGLSTDISKVIGFMRYQELRSNNEALTAKLASRLVDSGKLHILELENQKLRDLTKLNKPNSKHVIAQIIAADNLNNRSAIVINKGSHDGIKIGLPVVIQSDTYATSTSGVIIGKISSVGNNFSEIRSLSNPLSKTTALILTKDGQRAHGLVSGDLKLGIAIDLIPKNKTISAGDIVVTSGLEDNVPQGLVIGQIKNITTEDRDIVWQNALIEAPYNLDAMSFVSVVLP